jgi:hypothetical protein
MAFKFNTDFINLGPLTSTNFGIEPIDVSNVGPVAPLSDANLLASASRAASSPIYSAPSQNVINTAYLKTLGRPADPDGLAFYSSQLEDGRSVGDILADLNYVAANQATTAASDAPITPEFNPADYRPFLSIDSPTTTTPSPLNTITLTPRTEQRDFTPTPVSSFETLKINPTLASKPITPFDPGEFVGPVAPGSPKPSPTTATDLTLTPSFLTQVQAEEDVRQAFDRVLGRQPFAGSGSGLEYWTNELVKGNVTLADLDQAIAFGAQGGDRLAANKFLGTNYFKVADPTTVPYASLLQPTTTVTDQPSVVETYNQKAQEREEQDKPLFNTWEGLPNIDETEIQMAKDAGYQSPGAYFLAKVESTDPSLSSWRESTRQEILGSKDLKDQYEDLYKPPIDRDAEETIYQELKRQYEVANENGFGYRHESDLEAIWRREAGILAASGVKSIYDIGTRSVDRSSVIEVGSSRPNYQWMTEPSSTIQNVYKRGDDYYYESGDSEGPPERIKIDPARIIDVQEDVRKSYDAETGNESVYSAGFKIQVKDDPRIDLINKNTNDPVYDIELHNEWRDDPSAYNLMGRSGSDIVTIDSNRGFDRIHTNYGVRGAADLSFQMIPDGQGGEIPFILPIYRSTKTDLTPLVFLASAFLGPYAGTIGQSLGFTGAGATAVGAGVISAGTQLVVNGKIDPGRLLASAATAGIAETGGFTGSDIAERAADLAQQGLSSAQIIDDLVSMGVNSVTANLAGTFASAGIAVEIAPMITAGVQNMGLTALAMGELDADALTKSFLTGAGGEASSLAVDKIIGAENLKLIADATGLTQDQVGSIATSALMNGINSEVTGTNNFFDSVFQTLVVSGVSTATANKVATALDDTTSDKGRAAIVGATKNIMDVAGTAAWNDIDVGDALEAMAPGIIGSALSTYVRTPETTKTDDKDKTVEAPVAATKQLSESEIANQLEENLIFDGRQATSQEQAATQAKNSGFNTFIYDNKTYTISPEAKPIDLSESRIRQDLDEGLLYDGRDAKSLNDAAQLARNEGFNTFIYGDKTYTIPSQAELRENANLEISKQTTFGSAFSKARELLGPGQTFDWQGKSYSTATAEERPDLVTVKPGDVTQTDTGAGVFTTVKPGDVTQTDTGAVTYTAPKPGDVTQTDTGAAFHDGAKQTDTGAAFHDTFGQTDTGAAFHMNIGRKYTPAEMDILNASLADIGKNADQIPTSEMDFVTAAVTGKEVPVVGDKISADIVAPFVTTLGTLTRGGAGITDYTRGTLEALEVIDSTSSLANGMKDMANAMNKTAKFQIGEWALNQEQQFMQKVQNADGALNKAAALAQAIYDHPSAVLTLSGSEIMEEIPSIAAMLATGGTTAVAKFLSLGAGALLNGMESGGQAYNEAKQLALDAGLTEDAAHTQAQYAAAGSAAVGAVLGTFAEAPLVRGLTAGKGVVSTSVKREMATEFPEEFAQTGMTDYFGSGKFDANNALSNAFIALPIAGTTAGTISTGVSLSQTSDATANIISANTNNSFEVQQEVNNILGSSNNIQEASQSIVNSLTDMGMNPGAAVAVANTVAAEQVVNNINSQLTEDSKFSLNALNSQVGISSEGEPVTLGEYIGSSATNLGPNVFVSPDIAIGTKNDGSILTVADISGSLDMTQTKGDITTQTTTQTNPETNTTIKTETKTGPDTNITTTTETNPNTNTQTNTVTNTNTNIQTEINVDANTVVATEINLDTNIKTDITTNIDKIIEDLVDTGVKPEDALKIAVEEVKEDAKSKKSTTAQKSGAGTALTGAGMALPALGSLVDEGRDLNPLVTTGKREFESPLAAFMRMVSGEENVEPPPVEKKEPSMDYYSYGKSAEIDDVLGDATPSGLPSFEFAELGEMGPSFQMRSGGLVPPFAGGGPLTMAAGKLRKDYRQGDAVEGPGDGQSDDIPAMLADGEFVIPADVVAALGNGSNKAGADKLYDMMHNIRRQARQGNPKDLPKPAKSPLQYMTRR